MSSGPGSTYATGSGRPWPRAAGRPARLPAWPAASVWSAARGSWSSPLPEAWPDGLLEVALGHQIALRVGRDRKLRQRPRRGPEDDRRACVGLERGLVARAEDPLRRLLVQCGGAAEMRADFRVGDDVVDRPVHRVQQRSRPVGPVVVPRGYLELARLHLDDDRGGFGQSLVVVLVALRYDGDHAARGVEVGGRDRLVRPVHE